MGAVRSYHRSPDLEHEIHAGQEPGGLSHRAHLDCQLLIDPDAHGVRRVRSRAVSPRRGVVAGSPGKHSSVRIRFPPVTQHPVTRRHLGSPSIGEADPIAAVFVWIEHEQAPSVMAAVESARPDDKRPETALLDLLERAKHRLP